jgi:integrase/recombinase XerD
LRGCNRVSTAHIVARRRTPVPRLDQQPKIGQIEHRAEQTLSVTLPVAPELLAHFIRDQTTGAGTADGRPRRLTTLRRYLSTLATLHRLLELPDPTKHPLVTNTVKAQARGSGGPG